MDKANGVHAPGSGGRFSMASTRRIWVTSVQAPCLFASADGTPQIEVATGAIVDSRALGLCSGNTMIEVDVVGTRIGKNGSSRLDNPNETVTTWGIVFSPPINSAGAQIPGAIWSSC